MNILQIVTRENNRSGSGIQMMQLSLELVRRGHRVTALYKHHSKYDADFLPYQDSGVNMVRMPLINTRLSLSSLSDVVKIRKFIKQGNFDIVHSHSNAADQVFLAAIGINIPVVSNRGMSAKLNWGKGFKYRSRVIKKVIAVSQDTKDIMMQSGHLDDAKIDVIYGSVDVERFCPTIDSDVTRNQLAIADEAYVVGYTGSVGGRKGIDLLLQGFRQFADKHPDARLLLVGVDKHQLAHHNVEIDSALADKVILTGFVHRPELIMKLFDVFIFSGTRDEGLTGAIREAASMQLPIISTDVGGNRELVINKKSGLLIEKKRLSGDSTSTGVCYHASTGNAADGDCCATNCAR